MATNGDVIVDTDGHVDEKEAELEVFSDAIESGSVNGGHPDVTDTVDLLWAIEDANEALLLFLNNRFAEAVKRVEPWANKSIYHALALSCLRAVEAALTFDPADAKVAEEVVNAATDFVNGRRRRGSLMNNTVAKMLITPNYDLYTEEEVHAELVYAECVMVKCAVSVFGSAKLIDFIRAGIRSRISYQVYKECQTILENRTWSNKDLKGHFESGVNLGLGGVNVALAQLPTHFRKAAEFLGFSGDQELGFEQLHNGHRNLDYLRAPFCAVGVLGFQVGFLTVFGDGVEPSALGELQKYYQPLLKKYQQSSIIQYGGARIELASGNFTRGVSMLEEIVSNTNPNWNRFQQPSLCELSFSYVSMGKYRSALKYVEILCKEGTWSAATYSYAKAAILCMCDDRSAEETLEMTKRMKDLPSISPNVGDNTYSAENFLNNKACKFQLLDNWLPLPALEIMYLYNTFLYLKGKCDFLEPIVAKIERTIEELPKRLKDSLYYLDAYFLLIFMKGLCLRHMGFPLSAEQLFIEVIENEQKIVDDKYVVHFTMVELANVYIESKNYEMAVNLLKTARSKANLRQMYVLELRIHLALQKIERMGFTTILTPTEEEEEADKLIAQICTQETL